MDVKLMAKSQQDTFQRAKERIDDAKEKMREQHERVREDLRFSNPADPQQWQDTDKTLRSGRPTLTLDRTNQFISQVSNDMRQNNPGIQVIGVDDKADPKVAETLSGIIRHIEYRSRASHAYDTAGDLAVRCGMGWLRVVPEVVDAATNEQEIRIMRVIDPTSCGLDPNSTEVDGSDAMYAYAETRLSDRAFKAAYPKAKAVPFGDAGWYSDGFLTIAEYFEVCEEVENRIIAINPEGFRDTYSEAEYWALSQQFGGLQVLGTVQGKRRQVKWQKMTGAEILEETSFPSQYLPIIPMIGSELWVDGRRHVCGLTRRLMDGQRLHNYQMSAMAEFLASQPKAPFFVPFEGIEGHEESWKRLNKGNPAYLTYNSIDDQGRQLPGPSRIAPPPMPGAYAQMAQFAVEEMQASVGMYKANLGQQGNETSGRAIRARQMEGDTATFHFIDNQGRSIEQLGRVVVDMIPKIYDTSRIKHIVGLDGEREQVRIDPQLPVAAKTDPKGKVVAINPNIGKYDVRIKVGPSYTTMREEAAQQLSDMIQAQPQLAPILGPMWAKLRDMPEADKISRLLLAMAPPQVQQIESGDDDIPPQAQAKIQELQTQLDEMHKTMDMATEKLQELQSGERETTLKYLAESAKLENDEYRAHTERMKALQPAITPDQVQALVLQTLQEALSQNTEGGEELEHAATGGPQEPPGMPMGGEPPEQMPQQPQQPSQGGFFTPDEAQQGQEPQQ